ncbi:MAG: hypothetical protein AAF609_02110 [Cyanobacteria bacterium P01_C01_bin.120]
MTKLAKALRNLLMVVLLAVCLTSCGTLKATIPGYVATAAVTRQAQQAQMTLWQKVSTESSSQPKLSVSRVEVRDVHRVKVADASAYEVTGTYRYRLRYPRRSPLEQSQVPFSVILQAKTETQPWQLLEIEGTIEHPQSWHWHPLIDEPTA